MQKTRSADCDKTGSTAFFHPDFNRRLRHLTESADLPPFRHPVLRTFRNGRSARGLARCTGNTPTAGGEFRPALKTG